MKATLHVTRLRFTPANLDDKRRGLLGYVACDLNGQVGIDGIAVRRTLDGRHVLSFPARRDRAGAKHSIVWPVDDDAREDMERQVFLHLQAQGVLR